MKKYTISAFLFLGHISLVQSAAEQTIDPTKAMVCFLTLSREESFEQRSREIAHLTGEELKQKISSLCYDIFGESSRDEAEKGIDVSDDVANDLHNFYVARLRHMIKKTFAYHSNKQIGSTQEDILLELASPGFKQCIAESSQIKSLTNIFLFERHVQRELKQSIHWKAVDQAMNGVNVLFLQGLINYCENEGAKLLDEGRFKIQGISLYQTPYIKFDKTAVKDVKPFVQAYKAPGIDRAAIFNGAFDSIDIRKELGLNEPSSIALATKPA